MVQPMYGSTLGRGAPGGKDSTSGSDSVGGAIVTILRAIAEWDPVVLAGVLATIVSATDRGPLDLSGPEPGGPGARALFSGSLMFQNAKRTLGRERKGRWSA